jgi:hypothetical protein
MPKIAPHPEKFQQWRLNYRAPPPYHVERCGYAWLIVDKSGRNVASGRNGRVGFRSQGMAEYVLSLGLWEAR